jgi:xylose isomerase
MIEDKVLTGFVDERYAGWSKPEAQKMLSGELSLEDIAKKVGDSGLQPQPRSGRQEYLENAVNRYV